MRRTGGDRRVPIHGRKCKDFRALGISPVPPGNRHIASPTRDTGPPSFGSVLSRTRTFAIQGVDAVPVDVEIDIHRGLPSFSSSDFLTLRCESRERVRAAIVNSGFDFPLTRITASPRPPICARRVQASILRSRLPSCAPPSRWKGRSWRDGGSPASSLLDGASAGSAASSPWPSAPPAPSPGSRPGSPRRHTPGGGGARRRSPDRGAPSPRRSQGSGKGRAPHGAGAFGTARRRPRAA